MPAPAQPLPDSLRIALESRLLPAWLPGRRWWRSKSRTLESLAIEAAVPLPPDAIFCVVRAAFERGDDEHYAVPIAFVPAERAADFPGDALAGAAPDGRIVADACHDPAFRDALLGLLAGETEASGYGGLLRGRPERPGDFADLRAGTSRLYSGEQSNTSFSAGETVAVKLYRRFEAGIHPEPEMLRFLRRAGYRGTPAFLSSLEWVPADGSAPCTLALAQEFVRDARDAWTHVVDALKEALRDGALPRELTDLATTLGSRVGELHATLASHSGEPGFAPEPLTDPDLAAVREGGLKRLENAADRIDAGTARRLRGKLRDAAPAGPRIRVHGDLHLGQILLGSAGPLILDFEGEPGRPLAEARRKASPLRDAAGMLRSFHYAAHVAARDGDARLEERAEAFADALARAFLKAYFEASTTLIPRGNDLPGIRNLLNFFVLEKALYELEYERDNRPGWMDIPLRGLRRIAG